MPIFITIIIIIIIINKYIYVVQAAVFYTCLSIPFSFTIFMR